jgi:hypothetical protein
MIDRSKCSTLHYLHRLRETGVVEHEDGVWALVAEESVAEGAAAEVDCAAPRERSRCAFASHGLITRGPPPAAAAYAPA